MRDKKANVATNCSREQIWLNIMDETALKVLLIFSALYVVILHNYESMTKCPHSLSSKYQRPFRCDNTTVKKKLRVYGGWGVAVVNTPAAYSLVTSCDLIFSHPACCFDDVIRCSFKSHVCNGRFMTHGDAERRPAIITQLPILRRF
uniref:Peptidase S1 domain-containing protein n=1 Tax=Heterorhabditis bacteriophora TaxID=37862 RepID=A0A1I7XBA4_HETBA